MYRITVKIKDKMEVLRSWLVYVNGLKIKKVYVKKHASLFNMKRLKTTNEMIRN